jgi:hypothetical protein
MMNSLFNTIFGCAHDRTTFPLTPLRHSDSSEKYLHTTYVVCLDCGKEFEYSWKEMRMGSLVGSVPKLPHDTRTQEAVVH